MAEDEEAPDVVIPNSGATVLEGSGLKGHDDINETSF
jgi:hypothetical protein